MNDLQNCVKKIIGKYYSALSKEEMCALDLYTHGIRERDFGSDGKLANIGLPDTQRIPIICALRDIERRAK